KIRLVFRQIQFRKLNFRSWIGMVLGDLLPDFHGCIGFTQSRERLRQRHLRIAVVMFWILGHNALEQWASLGRFLLPEQALAQVRSRVNILGIALQGGAIAGFGVLKLALLEINVAQLRVVMSLVQMMNLGLELLDPAPVKGSRQFETTRGRRRGAIDG